MKNGSLSGEETIRLLRSIIYDRLDSFNGKESSFTNGQKEAYLDVLKKIGDISDDSEKRGEEWLQSMNL